jgi:hypothetical protein
MSRPTQFEDAMAETVSNAAWQAGFEAGRQRRPLLSNPYPAGTPEFETWQAGWRKAEGVGRRGDEAPPTGAP